MASSMRCNGEACLDEPEARTGSRTRFAGRCLGWSGCARTHSARTHSARTHSAPSSTRSRWRVRWLSATPTPAASRVSLGAPLSRWRPRRRSDGRVSLTSRTAFDTSDVASSGSSPFDLSARCFVPQEVHELPGSPHALTVSSTAADARGCTLFDSPKTALYRGCTLFDAGARNAQDDACRGHELARLHSGRRPLRQQLPSTARSVLMTSDDL